MSNTQVRYTLTLDASSYDAQLAAAASATNRFGQTAGTAVQPLNAQLSALTATAGQARAQIGAYSATWSQSFARISRGADEATPKVKGLGVSAGQTAAAMRMLPAQITDITTSLASGMPVWLVAIQQGGQIKDSFGGVGPAFKAITGAITPLVAGLGTLAVVGGSVAAAYYQGSKEGDEFRRSLILTGNASGTTAAQMDDMARRAAGAAESTRGATAAAVAQLAGTGQVAGDQLERFSAAAVRWEKATGIAVASTAEQFKALGKDPVAATIKLNEETNFLTKEVWAQITALERQGKTTDAVAVAQGAWADTIESRAKDMQGNLGSIERAWNGVTGAAKKAWDAMLNIGREDTAGQKIENLQARIAETQRKLESGFGETGGGAATGRAAGPARRAQLEAELATLRGQLSTLQAQTEEESRAAAEKAKRAAETAAQAKWDQQSAKYLSDQAKMEQEIVDARSLGVAAGLKIEEIEKRVAAIRASYAKKGGQNQELNAYQNLVAAINQKTEAARQESQQGAELTESQRQQIALDEGLASGKLKLTEAHKKHVQQLIDELAVVERKNQGELQRQKGLNALVQEELESVKALAEVDDRRMKLWLQESTAATRSLESARDSHELATLEFSLLGKSSKERQVAIDLRRIELDLSREIKRIEGLDVTDQAKNDLRQKANDLAYLQRSAAVSKATLEEAAGFIDSLDRTAHDAFVSVAKDGVDAFERIGDTLQSAILDALYQMTVKKWIVSIAAQITGSGSSAGQLSGGGGGLMGTFNNISSLWDTGSKVAGWLGFGTAATGTGLMATAGTGMALASTAGTGLGLTAAAGTGLGLAGTGTGLGLSAAAGTGTALTAGAGAGAAGGAGLMSSVGAAMPYIGIALAVASLLSGVDDSGTYHTGGAGSAGPSGARAGVTAESLGMASTVVADATTKAMEQTATSMAAMFNGLGLGAFNVSTAFADDTSKDGAWGALRIERDGQKLLDWNDGRTSRWAPKEFADGEKGLQQYTAALAVSVRDALEEVGLPGWATGMLDALGDAPTFEQISGVMQSITVVDQTMDTLGRGMSAFANISDEAVSALAEATGGIANLQQGLAYFYQEFFSESDRVDIATAQLTESLAELGQQLPETRAEFKDMVNAAIEAGDEDLAAKLLALSGAVASILPATEDATAAVEAAAEQRDKALQQRVDREKALWQQQADAAASLRGEVQGLFDALGGHITDLRAQALGPVLNARQGQAFIDQALQAALGGGVLPDQAGLETAIAAARGGLAVGAGQYGNSIEASYAAAKLAGDLETLQGVAGQQLTQAERQYQAAVTQIDQLDQSLDLARDQLDLTQVGIDATLGVTDAIVSLQEALKPGSTGRVRQQQNSGGGGGGGGGYGGSDWVWLSDGNAPSGGGASSDPYSMNATRYDIYGGLLAEFADTRTAYEQAQVYLNASRGGELGLGSSDLIADAMLAAGATQAQVDQVAAAAAGYQDYVAQTGGQPVSGQAFVDWYEALPRLAVGTNYVPEDGPYFLHKGESVQPVPYNPAAGGSALGGGTQRLEALFIEMLGRISRLEGVMDLVNTHSKTTADTLTRVAPGDALIFATAPTIR